MRTQRRLRHAGCAVLAMVMGACSQSNDTDSGGKPPAMVGQTSAYTLDASRLPPYMGFQPADLDPAVSACESLDGYVNGKWLAANPIPSDRVSWGPFDTLQERSLAVQRQLAEQAAASGDRTGAAKVVGDLWASGMDAERVNRLGLQPIQTQLDAIDALADGAAVAGYLRSSTAVDQNPLFGFGPAPDFADSTRMIAYVEQGGLGLPDRNYYFDADKADKLAAYRAHITRVLELSGVEPSQASGQADAVLAFETRLAGVSKSREEFSTDVSLYYHPVTVAEADALTPEFPWSRFFVTQGVTVDDHFSLSVPAFHQEVARMLTEIPVTTWRAYLRFHAVDAASPYLSDAFADEAFAFYGRAMRGQKEQKERGKRVLGSMQGLAGEAMGELYVQVAFPPASKAAMQALVGNLAQALKQRIEKLAWMEDDTRTAALAKWATFVAKIGYPDKWRDWSGAGTTNASYVDNVRALMAFNARWEAGKIGKPVDRTEWEMPPQMVNAYYNPQFNEIVFPAAILQPPFFDPDADEAFNYGAIGGVIGHEMIHGYDDQGSRFGPSGNFENWWREEDAGRFRALTTKLEAQFDAYEVQPGLHVNGALTLGENIADLGGLNTAFDAMHLAAGQTPDPMVGGMTREQRFFLGWATSWRGSMTPDYEKVIVNSDPHAPDRFRAIAAPSNMPAFAQAFGCREGDAMVRSGDQRVVIW
ncbi:MAG: peptidase [Pseudomonadales bacterium]|nr:peptidase [Pseudomonadales bacterium]